MFNGEKRLLSSILASCRLSNTASQVRPILLLAESTYSLMKSCLTFPGMTLVKLSNLMTLFSYHTAPLGFQNTRPFFPFWVAICTLDPCLSKLCPLAFSKVKVLISGNSYRGQNFHKFWMGLLEDQFVNEYTSWKLLSLDYLQCVVAIQQQLQ